MFQLIIITKTDYPMNTFNCPMNAAVPLIRSSTLMIHFQYNDFQHSKR